jgi:hypothetical protein
MALKVVIVPIFWGDAWNQGKGPIPWKGVYVDVQRVARSYYLNGLAGHGLAPVAQVEPQILVPATQSQIPNNFNADQIWKFLDGEIDTNRTVPPPGTWDQTKFRVYYGIAIAPNHANANPNHFGENNPYPGYRGVSAGYATANSDRPGVVETFWHEVIEGASGDQIGDACEKEKFPVDGIRVQRYFVDGRCWPYIDLKTTREVVGPTHTEGPFEATVPIWNGLCGEEKLSYHIVYTSWSVTAVANEPHLATSAFRWQVNGQAVPPGRTVLNLAAESIQPPLKQDRQLTTVTVEAQNSGDTLTVVTKPTDGNYDLDVQVESDQSAASNETVTIEGMDCPELDDATNKCRDWYKRNTLKLDRDWNKWVDPSDPLIRLIRERPEEEQERLVEFVSAARQLEKLGRPEAEEIATRLASVLRITPVQIFGRN